MSSLRTYRFAIASRMRLAAGPVSWMLAAVLCFIIGYALEAINLKGVVFTAFAVLGALVLALPYHWALCFMFLVVAFEGMAKIVTGYNPIVHVSVDLVIVALCARWFLLTLWRRESLPKSFPPLTIGFALHLTWYLVQFMNPYSIGLIPSLAGFKVYGTLVLTYYLGYYVSSSYSKVRLFMFAWVVIVAIQVVLSLQQGAIGPSSVLSISPGYADALRKFGGYAFRPFGTTHSAGGPATFVFLTFPFILYFLVTSRKLAKLPYLALVPLAVVTLLLCQVRASIVKTGISGLGFVATSLQRVEGKARVQILSLVGAVVVMLAFAIPRLTSHYVGENADNARALERSMSVVNNFGSAAGSRSGSLDRIIEIAQQVPLGAGLSHAGAAAGKFWELLAKDPYFPGGFFADNFWALVIAELGIPGALILTYILGSVLFQGFWRGRRIKHQGLILCNSAIVSAFFASVVGLWGAEGIVYNPESTFCWFFAGVLMRLPEIDSRESSLDGAASML